MGNNPDCAKLMYSTNFNGTYDIASIRQASWTDISDRFHLASTLGTSAVYENSGELDISDLFLQLINQSILPGFLQQSKTQVVHDIR